MKVQEYSFIKYKVRKLLGIDLNSYKSAQVQRRLRTYLLRSGQSNWPTFFRAIQDDPVALNRFKDYLTINVSSFFRDVAKFEHLEKSILPQLLAARPRLRVWSAGCSHGHEPYSLAILLVQATSLYSRHTILATDIDRSALERAQAGGPYTAKEVKNVSPTLLERYFKRRAEQLYLVDRLRQKITFRYHNLLEDPFEEDFDLIVCRNVVIYFMAEAKKRLYRRFYDALRPGGVLFVGGTEVVAKASEIGFETAGISFYRHPTTSVPPWATRHLPRT